MAGLWLFGFTHGPVVLRVRLVGFTVVGVAIEGESHNDHADDAGVRAGLGEVAHSGGFVRQRRRGESAEQEGMAICRLIWVLSFQPFLCEHRESPRPSDGFPEDGGFPANGIRQALRRRDTMAAPMASRARPAAMAAPNSTVPPVLASITLIGWLSRVKSAGTQLVLSSA